MDGQLATFGIDPSAGQLSDAEYAEAMAELKRRRVAAMANMTPEEQAHIQYKRSTILWHAHAVRLLLPMIMQQAQILWGFIPSPGASSLFESEAVEPHANEGQAHLQYKRSTILWHAHAVRLQCPSCCKCSRSKPISHAQSLPALEQLEVLRCYSVLRR